MAKKTAAKDILKIQSKHVVFISDIHFGVYRSTEEWQDNISSYFQNWFFPYIKERVAKYPDVVLICLGDVYDDRNSIDIDVNNLCIDTFEELASILPCYIINGNHDLSKKTNKGNSSLRSLSNINNLTVIQEPRLIHFMDGRKIVKKIAAIPYLGDCNEENKELLKYSGEADYALMHTDISNMKLDNGMTIVGAVDAEKFSGRVISGHIHKRQETKKAIYVGNPYHTKRSDVGNQKGIYMLDLETDEFDFTPNNFSPVFLKMDISTFVNMTEKERMETLKDAYVDVMVDESVEDNYKMPDVYEMMNRCPVKRGQFHPVRSKKKIDAEGIETGDIEELGMQQLVENAIDLLPDTDDEMKAILKEKSSEYYKNALETIEEV